MEDLGLKFGRLTVVAAAAPHRTPGGSVMRQVVARCDCGRTAVFRVARLRSGHTKSCGCIRGTARHDIEPGVRFTRLVVVRETTGVRDPRGRTLRVFTVACDCGAQLDVRLRNLLSGNTKSCGCLDVERRREVKVHHVRPGDRWHRLTAVKEVSRGPHNRRRFLWRCDCGAQVETDLSLVLGGNSKSCGCLKRDNQTTHGHTVGGPSPTYRSWLSMIQRCTNPNANKWEHYGGRGIEVCNDWRGSFARFLSDMGARPAGTTLDRINVDGNYEPGNCRWATLSEQNRNQRRHRKVAA